jgi:hypothetical protein
MTSPRNFHVDNTATSPSSILLEEVFFKPLLDALQSAKSTRVCTVIDDANFVTLAILRVLQSSKTGRDFIQSHGIPNLEGLTRSNYFASLASERRLDMMVALEQEFQKQQRPDLLAKDDRLAMFPELNHFEIWAGDGHMIAHATHDSRNEKK